MLEHFPSMLEHGSYLRTNTTIESFIQIFMVGLLFGFGKTNKLSSMYETNKLSGTFDFVALLLQSAREMPATLQWNTFGLNGFSTNALFWTCLALGTLFFYFHKFLQVFLKSHRIKPYKCPATIRFVWHICFYAAALLFLNLYYKYFLATRISRDVGRWFPKYENALFMPTDNCTMFQQISLLLTAFYVTSAVMSLRAKDFSEAATRLLYVTVLVSFNAYGFENYSVILNMVMSLYSLFTDCLLTVALHTPDRNKGTFRSLLFLRILSWSYLYLNLLPFMYLIPTLYAKKFKLWLNVCLWVWYGSSVWNSPILQFFYHQIYHINSYENCIGNNSVSRCILLKDSPDVQHFKNMQQAFYEILIAHKKDETLANAENAPATAYQTMRCAMTLKRKLRHIRDNQEIKARTGR